MKIKFLVLLFIFVASTSFLSEPVSAQCAMCTLNAENGVKDGNTQAKGLNDGILFLLAVPYIAVAAIGFLWYKKYRRNHPKEKIFKNIK